MGSKSKIAKHIVSLFPNADNFVDLFAGGGAVTHYAMTTNKYKYFVFNDINPLMPKAFEMALNGEFENENRWISREEFFRLRDTDPYAAICFSFGNNLSNYAYGKDIEPIKEAYHYALFFGDYSLAKERMGIDFSPLEKCPTIKERYTMLMRIVNTTHPQQRFESAQRRIRCCEMEGIGSNPLPLSDVIEFYSTDYQAVPIPENSVIYCDIPYKNTGTYQRHKKTEFDYERFYNWAYRQTQPIFISEYWMPEDRFVCIAEIQRRETFSKTNNSKKTTERIFIPKHQQTNLTKQLNLFQCGDRQDL